MEKECINQIKNIISDYRARLLLLVEFLRSPSNYLGEQELDASGVLSFFDEIVSDLDNLEIPDFYQGIISGIVDSFRFLSLPLSIDGYEERKFPTKSLKSIQESIAGLAEQSNSYNFYKSIGFASKNVVVVGANGSGKSTLACNIKNVLQKKDGLVIPAQKNIIIPSLTFIPSLPSIKPSFAKSQSKVFDSKVTYSLDNNRGNSFNIIGSQNLHFQDLYIMLFAERASANARCGSKIRNNETPTIEDAKSTIDIVIDIWNELMDHRKLICNEDNELKIQYDGVEYPAFQMSDGERLILYLVAEVNLAPQNALIVVDEPELHLHKAISDKLWDRLEALRPDCLFFYLTHDLQFAASRDAIKCWIKSYDPNRPIKWEINRVSESDVPQELLLKLLGSRKKILFCEGKYDGIDYKLYTRLFSNFTIVPVESCKNVINYTKAFNEIKDKYAEAYGLIDRDFKEQNELDELKVHSIFSYEVAEVENVLLSEDLLNEMNSRLCSNADVVSIKNEILKKLSDEKKYQAARYVEHRIVTALAKINGLKGSTLADVKKNYSEATLKIKPDEWYKERMTLIEKIVDCKDFEKALRIYNNKGLVGIVERHLGVKDYKSKALKYITDISIPRSLLGFFPTELQ